MPNMYGENSAGYNIGTAYVHEIQSISHLYDDLQATNIEAENIGIINKYYLINNWTLLQKEGNKNEIKEEKNNFNIQRKLLKMSDILV